MDIGPEGGADNSNKGTAVGKGKKNIYTYSWYAFAKIHVHGAICRERGLLTETKKMVIKK